MATNLVADAKLGTFAQLGKFFNIFYAFSWSAVVSVVIAVLGCDSGISVYSLCVVTNNGTSLISHLMQSFTICG